MEVKAPLQAVLDHQLNRMLDDPLHLERVSVLNVDNFDDDLEYIIKYGYDGMSQVLFLGHCIFDLSCIKHICQSWKHWN